MVASLSRRGNGPAAYVPDLVNSIKDITNSIAIDVFVSAPNVSLTTREIHCDTIFNPKVGFFASLMMKIPKVRVLVWDIIRKNAFSRLMNQNDYDCIIFHSVPPETYKLLRIAPRNNTKFILFPWGSEVLRAKGAIKEKVQKAFNLADYIRGDSCSFITELQSKYPGISENKFVNITYASPGLTFIDKNRDRTREELINELKLPDNHYYIVCGYNAYSGQQHKRIIEAISTVKDFLPSNYLLVFPITYGLESGVCEKEIDDWCNMYQLNHLCLTEFMTDSQMACLHLLTDLFIHVQLTDVANSFIMESVYAGTTIINGSWLRYPEMEEDRMPYYLCSTIDELPQTIIQVLKDNPQKGSNQKIIKSLSNYTWPSVAERWVEFLKNHIQNNE